MNFLDIALPLAEKGFRVFPLIPKAKRPFAMAGEADHFDAATTDAEQIRQWSLQEPKANVGISPDEIWCFLETDDEAALREACSDLPPEVWDTTRVSARENRCYYVFRQTMRTRKAGNMTRSRDGQENLLEFKQHRVYVTGPGSIHEKTGKPYDVEWHDIPAMPDVLLNRLCELNGAPKATDAHTMSEETKRKTELLDRFLEHYEVPTLGDWFNKGKQWLRPIVCPWDSAHENSNQGTSTCIVFTEGGGFGFDCKHRCSEKTWHDFRAELESSSDKARFAFVESTPAVVVKQHGPLPMIAHASLAETFLRDNHDFLCIYDVDKRPIAQWVKTRWDVSENDTLLWRAVADYLKDLFPQYKPPEKGPDPRKRFYDASFIAGVVRCVKPYLPAVKAEVFDQDPYLLGLPDCRVVDLGTSAIRDMQRQDYITRRVNLSPDANCPTSRFDRFIQEITCGDGALAGLSSPSLLPVSNSQSVSRSVLPLGPRKKRKRRLDSDTDGHTWVLHHGVATTSERSYCVTLR